MRGGPSGRRREEVVAVRRASQFKATLSARNRLISLVDDSFKVIEDYIFTLDT